MSVGLGELMVLAVALVVALVILLLRARKTASTKYDATKTIAGSPSTAVVFETIRSRTRNLGAVKQLDPLLVEGFNSNLGGARQVTQVAFSVRPSDGKTVTLAAANQRPSIWAWAIGLVGLAFFGIPTVAAAARVCKQFGHEFSTAPARA